MKLASPSKYRTFAVVSGKGPFPADMLRYDSCYPYGNGDAYKISCQRCAEGDLYYYVILAQDSERAGGNWTPERWRSFGWACQSAFSDYYEARSYVELRDGDYKRGSP